MSKRRTSKKINPWLWVKEGVTYHLCECGAYFDSKFITCMNCFRSKKTACDDIAKEIREGK